VWLDGANGEGPGGRRQEYDWDRYHAVVRRLQPGAVISVCGPDVRWCGNEAGDTRPDEWSVVPRELLSAERTSGRSQQADGPGFGRVIRSDDRDLGSREAIAGHEDDLVWYPAEVNTSIRPGWFHHPAQDGSVRSADELYQIYLRAVGGNSCLLLNVPPGRDGRIGDADAKVLAGLGRRIEGLRARSIGFAPGSDVLELGRPRAISGVVVREDIACGQRIERVVVSGRRDGQWVPLASANSVGYQRVLTFPAARVDAVRVKIPSYRDIPVISYLAAVEEAET
jgi:alpha-L-fucosidase